jgi:hypothetical protein
MFSMVYTCNIAAIYVLHQYINLLVYLKLYSEVQDWHLTQIQYFEQSINILTLKLQIQLDL